MKRPLSKQLLGLAEWLEGQGLDHNAAMVRRAARIVSKQEKAK